LWRFLHVIFLACGELSEKLQQLQQKEKIKINRKPHDEGNSIIFDKEFCKT
jgi:hypothetical protein